MQTLYKNIIAVQEGSKQSNKVEFQETESNKTENNSGFVN